MKPLLQYSRVLVRMDGLVHGGRVSANGSEQKIFSPGVFFHERGKVVDLVPDGDPWLFGGVGGLDFLNGNLDKFLLALVTLQLGPYCLGRVGARHIHRYAIGDDFYERGGSMHVQGLRK
jgi:hypothetical protein